MMDALSAPRVDERTPLLQANRDDTSVSVSQTDATLHTLATMPNGHEITTSSSNTSRPLGVNLPHFQKVVILVGTFLATFLGSLDATVTASLMQPISSTFNKSQEASWLGTSYLLASLTFTPMYGRLSEILGRRMANASAIGIFTLGTMGCAMARSMNELIWARFVAGCGGGGMMTTSAIVISDLFELKERMFVTGISSLVWAVGGALGGPLGGFMNDLFGWRTAFMGQVPLLILALLSGLHNLNYTTPCTRVETNREKLARIDWLGCASLFLTFGSLLLSLALHNNELIPWSDRRVLVPTCLAPVFMLLFLYIEARIASEPLLPLGLLRQRTPLAGLGVIMLQAVTNWTLLYHLPIYFLAVEGSTASSAGAHLLPTSAAAALGGVSSGWIIHKTGRYWEVGVTATMMGSLSILSIVFLHPASPAWVKWLQILPFGFALSTSITTSLAAIMASVPQSTIPTVTGAIWLFRASGQVIGVGGASAVFQALLVPALKKRITGPGAAELINRIREDSSILNTLEPGLRERVREAFGVAVRGAFTVAFVGSVLTVCSYACIEVLSLETKKEGAVTATPSGQRVETDAENGEREPLLAHIE
ncbi:BQ5605_C003g02384 [Microbotryum silenes-dioicae]|uniref:BQ5605_C003g02384 protein n=1 Tax=Microbotryum silenes-dioicae TaxID=796604 RepID=A0A2X0M512_9BASI|nr:BQ5605_C003g02384 [Microbotryum silenes-dioicae]